jgi:hypothetical protein
VFLLCAVDGVLSGLGVRMGACWKRVALKPR